MFIKDIKFIKSLSFLLFKKDKDHDSRLSKSDFQQSVMQDPLLLECFGQCFPDQKVFNFLILNLFENETLRVLLNYRLKHEILLLTNHNLFIS